MYPYHQVWHNSGRLSEHTRHCTTEGYYNMRWKFIMQTFSLTKLVSLTLSFETAGASNGTPLFQAQDKAHVVLPVTG